MADPFSEVLQVAAAQSVLTGGWITGGRWSIRFPAPDKIKFFGAVRGGCWFVEGDSKPVKIEQGDFIIVAGRASYVMTSDPKLKPTPASKYFTAGTRTVQRISKHDELFMLAGHVTLTGSLLANVLPSAVHIRASAAQASVLLWIVDQLVQEGAGELPGSAVAAAQLVQLLFVQLLRAYMATPHEGGLLSALGDARIAPALRLMHEDPSRAWQLDELAKAAGMSRTNFALHFKAVAGIAPIAYLTAWRMRLAERALRERDVSVATLARDLGYASESAFSNAFKRVTGSAPRRYRSASRASPTSA